MASFDSVNYSVRPSKTVQRRLVFEGLRSIAETIDLESAVYVGLGSIWYTDFVQAHKILNIDDMVSIEANQIGYRRAVFNRAYRTITVLEGRAKERLPDVVEIEGYASRPWVVWLDYDSALDEEVVGDMQWTIENLPPNSIVLFTFSATQNAYGRPVHRPDRIQTLLGDIVPDGLSQEDCAKDLLPLTLSTLTVDYLKAETADAARPGGFIEAFKVPYVDSTAMVTVGGILPSKGAVAAIKALVSNGAWRGIVEEVIEAPPMTLKEMSTLQAELPAIEQLTRERIQELGFDLQERQLRSFQKYYKYLPSFAEIVS